MTDRALNIGKFNKSDKIMLMLLPFWAPLIPPLGISCLKAYLGKHGYSISTTDGNQNSELWEVHHTYLNTLKKYIPESKRGNFYMVGYDVFMNHLMAHIHYTDEKKYRELIKLLVSKNFFSNIFDIHARELCNIIKGFYEKLEDYIVKAIEAEKPEIVGISVYSVTLAPSLFAFRCIKEKYPYITTIMGGGVFADQLSEDSPNFGFFLDKTPYIDKIIVGEGERLFLRLLQGELPQEQRVYTLKDIDNELLDLSITDILDFSDFDVAKYTQMAGYTSRSCPFQCSFCSETVQWGKYRKKDASKVVNELVELYEKYKRPLFLLGDSLINPIVDELAQEFINRGIKLYWDGYLRADKPVCDTQNTMLWRKGGYYRARLGIESGSQHVLNLMNKKITTEQIKKAIASLAYAGIKTTTYWVIGHPGETEEDFLQTLELIEECKDDIYEVDWHPFYYFPTGQVNSKKWEQENGISLLYPEDVRDMLITQTWTLNTNPSRQQIYDRLCRFEKHCKKLGIPNPYSLKDIYMADERWKSLHHNAVPSVVDLYK